MMVLPGNGIPPRRDRWPKIGSGREKVSKPNRLRQSPPIAGLWLVSGKSSGSKDSVVGLVVVRHRFVEQFTRASCRETIALPLLWSWEALPHSIRCDFAIISAAVRRRGALEAPDVRSHQTGSDLTALAASNSDVHDRSSARLHDFQDINAGWSSAK